MKRLTCAVVAWVMSVGFGFADPVVGTWQTSKDDNGNFGHIAMAACGAQICGTLSASFDSQGNPVASPHNGKKIVWDMMPQDDGTYRGGKIWAPDRDRTYNSRMSLAQDRLKVEGCVLGICRGQTWLRVN